MKQEHTVSGMPALILALLLTPIFCPPAHAQSRYVDLVTGLPGDIFSVRVQGTRAYLGAASQLVIYDITNPAAPVLQSVYSTPDFIERIAVSGTRAYLAERSSVKILDVSDPTSPTLLGSIESLENCSGIAIA